MSIDTYQPAGLMANPHIQTLLPWFRMSMTRPLTYQRERIELEDGDFIDLDMLPNTSHHCVLLLHGMGGSSQSHYIKRVSVSIFDAGFSVMAMNFRGCSGEPNRLPRSYHSGEISDLGFVLHYIQKHYQYTHINLVGFSLGGNVILKWLQQHQPDFVRSAVAISVPFDLKIAAQTLNRGFAKIYQRYLLKECQRLIRIKQSMFPNALNNKHCQQIRSILDFDACYTAPIHGFVSSDDYYQQCSTKDCVQHIQTPTLLIQAIDDPFMTKEALPDLSRLPKNILAEFYPFGGHVGFVETKDLFDHQPWLARRIIRYFQSL